MRAPPRHTVILGSYNRPVYVAQAIESVLRQTVQDFQLIVTDDGSNDSTQSVIHTLIDGDSRCEFITVPHIDDSRMRPDCANRQVQRINDAIPLVRGGIVHYLADDDWYDPQRFEAFDALFSDPSVVIGYGRLVYVNPDGSPDGRTRYIDRVDNPLNVLDLNQVAHRRIAFERVPKWANAFDFSSDGHFFLAISRLWRLHGVDRTVAFKRLHRFCMLATTGGTTGTRE